MYLSIFWIYGCVESVTNSQQSSVTPTIQINSPVTGDSVQVDSNLVSYQAADGTGGTGLSFFELYVNDKFIKHYDLKSDGTNPDIYLIIDSTLLGSEINYYIKVYNKSGKTKESDLQEDIYVRDKIPLAPSELILTKLNDFSVNVLWNDNSNNESGFELWRKDGGNGTYRKISTLPANTISTDDSGLSAFTDYFYKVRAFNNTGYSNFSNEVSTSSVPGGPWNLQAEAIGASIVHLTWTDFAVNELGFIIERTDPYTTQFERIAIVARGSTEYDDNTVQASTGYRYKVAYYTSTSVSGYSNEASIATYYTDVEGPTDLSALYDSLLNSVSLSWKNNNMIAKGTIVEKRSSTANVFSELVSLSADSIHVSDSNIQKGQTYYYRIRQSLGSKAYTPYSNEAKVTITN